MYNIYKIEKPGTYEVDIGRTEKSLDERLVDHKQRQQHDPQDRKVYDWLTTECIITLLEHTDNKEREIFWIKEYFKNGYEMQNTILYQYYGLSRKERYELDKAKGKVEIWSDNAKTPEKISRAKEIRSREKANANNRLYKKAKKEGLSVKEYKIKYKI